MKKELKMGFSQLSDADFEIKAQSIYNSMKENSYFPTTIPVITEIENAVTTYQSALTAAKSKGKNEIAVKNQSRALLGRLLKQLGNFVMASANEDLVMLVSSGFDLVKKDGSPELVKPESIVLSDGKNPGELAVKVSFVKGARTYNFQYAPDPLTVNSVWKNELSTSSKHTLRNLDSATRYWCRVVAIGPFGQMVYSDANSRVVQ